MLLGFTLGARTMVNKVCQPLISHTSKLQRPFVPKATGVFPPVGRAGETANSPEIQTVVFFFIGIYNPFNHNKSKHIKTARIESNWRRFFFWRVSAENFICGLVDYLQLWIEETLHPPEDDVLLLAKYAWCSPPSDRVGKKPFGREPWFSNGKKDIEILGCHRNRSKDEVCFWVCAMFF